MMEDMLEILVYLAMAYIVILILKSLRSILYVHLIAERLGHTLNLASYGKWAVITGSTDGIGKGYAKELARRGLNVFLISRSQIKLDNTAKEIRSQSSKIEVRTLAFDFSAPFVEDYDIIKRALNDLEVGILVNNVGVNSEWPDYFDSYSGGEKFWKNMIDTNCTSLMEMTHLMLPQMLKRGRGIVINLSSLFGMIPMPLNSLYSATKTFVRFFTHGLNEEYADKGIIFQSVHPYLVATKMSQMEKVNIVVQDPISFARSALNTVGIESETTGCLSHAVQHALMQFVPDFVATFFIKKICMNLRQKHFDKVVKSE